MDLERMPPLKTPWRWVVFQLPMAITLLRLVLEHWPMAAGLSLLVPERRLLGLIPIRLRWEQMRSPMGRPQRPMAVNPKRLARMPLALVRIQRRMESMPLRLDLMPLPKEIKWLPLALVSYCVAGVGGVAVGAAMCALRVAVVDDAPVLRARWCALSERLLRRAVGVVAVGRCCCRG